MISNIIRNINKENLQEKSRNDLIEIILNIKDTYDKYLLEYQHIELQSKEELIEHIISLNDRITFLENDIKIIKEDNKIIKEDNIKLKKEIIELKDEIIDLKYNIINLNDKLDKKDNDNKILKLIIVIQDLNQLYKLENILEDEYKNYIYDLHMDRLSGCHFLYERDSNALQNYKKKLILIELQKIKDNTYINNYFKQNYDNLIDKIIDYLKNNIDDNILPSIKECNKANYWIKSNLN
jgi:hypothetical protein